MSDFLRTLSLTKRPLPSAQKGPQIATLRTRKEQRGIIMNEYDAMRNPTSYEMITLVSGRWSRNRILAMIDVPPPCALPCPLWIKHTTSTLFAFAELCLSLLAPRLVKPVGRPQRKNTHARAKSFYPKPFICVG